MVSADAAIAAPFRASGPPRPMPGRIGLVAFWESHGALDTFLADHPYAAELADGWRVRIEPLRSFGSWPGLPSDLSRSRSPAHDGPAVVVTLGRLRLPRTLRFLRASRPAEAAALAAPGLVWGTALARPPFVSTVSLWESAAASSTYAYGTAPDAHARAIDADRRKAFHHRSAFVRFRPVEVVGRLDGRNPLGDRFQRLCEAGTASTRPADPERDA